MVHKYLISSQKLSLKSLHKLFYFKKIMVNLLEINGNPSKSLILRQNRRRHEKILYLHDYFFDLFVLPFIKYD